MTPIVAKTVEPYVRLTAAMLVLVVHLFGVYVVAAANGGDECPQATTTAEMQRCLKTKLGDADKELETLRNLLRRELSSEDWQAFMKADAAWLTFRQANCISAASLYRGGSLESVVMYTCLRQMTRDRSRDVRVIYKDVLKR